jgi:putative exporter of polyketide antibiotics
MLWRKSWWETRWGFLTILGLTILLLVSQQPLEQHELTEWATRLQQEATWLRHHEPRWNEDTRRFLTSLNGLPGYVWGRWFGALLIIWPVYAITMAATLIKSLSPTVKEGQGAAGPFTFSLPVSRRKPLIIHAAVLAVEMTSLALAPSLIYAIVIRSSGRWIPIGSTVIYALLLALGGMVFVAFTFLLIAVFNSQWKSMAIGFLTVVVSSVLDRALGAWGSRFDEYPWWHVYHVMSGESYFRYGRIPWLGLFASLALTGLMMFAAVRIHERRDF